MSKVLLAEDVSKAYEAATDEKGKDAVLKQAVATIQAHEKDHAAKDEEIAKHQESAKASKTEVEGLNKRLADGEKDLADANQTIADLGGQLDVQSKAPGAILQVKHGGKTYTVVGKKFVSAEGKTIEAADLVKNKAMIKELVEKGSGILQEQTD